MEVADLTLRFDRLPFRFNLHGLCDVQEGSRSTLIDLVDYWCERILEDPDAAVVVPGDLEDEDRPSTRAIRRAAFAERPEVPSRDAEKHMLFLDKKVIPRYVKLHKETKWGIVGILAGHHWTQLTPTLNSVQYICHQIERLSGRPCLATVGPRPGMYWGQMSAFLNLHFRGAHQAHSAHLVGHIQHGEGGGQTKASTLTKLDRAAQGFLADFYIRAHDCQIVATKDDQLYPKAAPGARGLLSRTVAKLNLGSATMGYEVGHEDPSYVEAKMMRPTAMGWGTIKFLARRARAFEDPQKNMKVEMRVEI